MPFPTVNELVSASAISAPASLMPITGTLTRKVLVQSMSDTEDAMTRQDADARLAQYRAMLKAWTMAVGGFDHGDSDALYRQLEEGQSELVKIAAKFPDKSYSVDMLINSRSRTWAGYASERIPRMVSRHP